MLKAYLDITLRRNADIHQYFVLQKIFQQLHLGFVEMQNVKGVVPIGVAFPEYSWTGLGAKLRLLSVEEGILENFDLSRRLSTFKDYMHLTGIRSVPSRADKHALYQRQQPRSAADIRRLERRMSVQEGISVSDAMVKLKGVGEQQVKTPYVNVRSASSGQRFRLFILKKVVDSSVGGGFNSYGLSRTATVPEF